MIDYRKFKVISFDIFDTLIFRNVNSPSDVFDLVEKKYNNDNNNKHIHDFKKNRMLAERTCRLKLSGEEISYKDIYDELRDIYSDKEVTELSRLEIEIEIMLCVPNPEIKNIFENAKKYADVVITSDMYLDEKVISNILERCGYSGYKKLYISSKYDKTKYTGSIFELLINDFNLEARDIVHIGDNKVSDYDNPKKYGISSIHYHRKSINTKPKYKNIVVNSMIENKYFDDYFQSFGYNILGPMLFDFVKWLKNSLIDNSISKVYFFSRDGYLMKKAFDIINNNDIDSFYFYTSRRSLLVPSFIKAKNVEELFKMIQIDKTYKKLKKRIGLEDIDISEYEKKYNIKENTIISSELLFSKSNIRNFFEEIFPMIIDNAKKEYNYFMQYIKENNLTEHSAIVDIGWYGNMQKYLYNLLDFDVNGFYLGLIPNGRIQKELEMKGFLFDCNHGYNVYEFEKTINSIMELLFTAPHGSVKKYSSNASVILYENEYENNASYKKIEKLQDGAIQFIKEFFEYDKFFDFEKLDDYLDILKNFSLNPSVDDAINWGNFVFHDNGSNYIAKSEKKSYYLLHPNRFLLDFKNSYWKIGFLKLNFSILIPIYRIFKVKKWR